MAKVGEKLYMKTIISIFWGVVILPLNQRTYSNLNFSDLVCMGAAAGKEAEFFGSLTCNHLAPQPLVQLIP